jgi:hypothetical protein
LIALANGGAGVDQCGMCTEEYLLGLLHAGRRNLQHRALLSTG